MNGVMMPVVSAGSNQVGASEMCTPQVNWPCGEARARCGRPVARENAVIARRSRRAIAGPPMDTRLPRVVRGESITLLLAAPLAEPCRQSRSAMRFCQRAISIGARLQYGTRQLGGGRLGADCFIALDQPVAGEGQKNARRYASGRRRAQQHAAGGDVSTRR